MPITFIAQDVNLASFPYIDVMVVTVHVDRWDVTRILIDNGSQAKILFMSDFEKMGYDKKQLKELMKPHYGFDGKRIEPVGVITLPISFGTPQNPHT
jgi:metal-dependent hydrolase (beta-lactamase superfamily II)